MRIVILAGGEGSRLWPLSCKDHPKPLLHLGGMYSLLQRTILRFLGAYEASSILVVASKQSASLVKEQCDAIDPTKNITVIEESVGRNTAPALALALVFLEEKKELGPLEPILVVPSDGLISPLDNFLEDIFISQKQAKEGSIVLFGVVPSKAETSYGYIKLGEKKGHFFTENTFIEKPSQEVAENLLLEGKVLWNTGHLLVTAKTFWEEMALYSPKIASLKKFSWEQVNEKWSEMPSISIDYALLEKSQKVLACMMRVSWSDVGTWDRVYEAFEKDKSGNVQIGDVINLDSKNSFFFAEDKKIVTIGLEDVVVVVTKDTVFLAKKEESYKVGALLKEKEDVLVKGKSG